jgi:hypothetical protein
MMSEFDRPSVPDWGNEKKNTTIVTEAGGSAEALRHRCENERTEA